MGATPVEVGCDWLSATSADNVAIERMRLLWVRMTGAAHGVSRETKPATWLGYMGERIDGAFFGGRHDGALVRLSGRMASTYALQVLGRGFRPSRLDLQVTIPCGPDASDILEHMFNDQIDRAKGRKRGPTLAYWRDVSGPTGMSIGARSSQIYCRVYDKGKESNDEVYAGCLRFEVELKGLAALAYADGLERAQDDQHTILRMVAGVFRVRGIVLPGLEQVQGLTYSLGAVQTPTESRMAWLSKQVAPSVRELCYILGYQKVYSAVFGDILQELAELEPVSGL